MSGDDLPQLDTRHAHPARVYNYWLGGKDNFAADREAAEQAIAANPRIMTDVRANRASWPGSCGTWPRECGVRQFLDIGTGLPAPTTPTRSPRRSPRTRGSSTSTTTAARSRATDPAATRAEPTAILGLRRCTARAARRTPNTTFGASAGDREHRQPPRVAQAPTARR